MEDGWLKGMQVNRVMRYIYYRGRNFEVFEKVLNQYGEPARDGQGRYIVERKCCLRGLYHTTDAYVSRSVGDTGISTTDQSPMILTPFCYGSMVEAGDIVKINEKYYIVAEVEDVSQMGLACDISLELKEGVGYVDGD